MQRVDTRLGEPFLDRLYVFAQSAERDAVQLAVVEHRTRRLTASAKTDLTISAPNLSKSCLRHVWNTLDYI